MQGPQQSSGQQVIQLQQTQQTPTTQTGGIQIVQQIVTPNGEIQQIPVCFHSNKNNFKLTNTEKNFPLILDSADAAATTNDSNASARRK